jgi:LuxR family maltose regulon positive regulatory protein
VASYLSARKLRSLWYQIDSGDNDLATFFYYLGLAAPKRKRSLPLFTPEYQMGLPIFTRNFLRELFSRYRPPFALVFDNYQEVDSNCQLHEVLQGGLAEIPPGGTVIFISRAEPPLEFAELRAKQTIEIIDCSELRFTRTEVNELVKRLAPGRWSKRAMDQLHETSDGWAAGLVLLLEQLRKEGEIAVKDTSNASQVLFDYFAGEIFKRTDPEVREILLQTSVLPRITAKMAGELTGLLTAGQVLADLHRQSYFTNRRPGSEPTYEYHPLFREYLLAQAKLTYPTEKLAAVQRRAAGILKDSGQTEAAAELYRDAEDWEALTKLICENAPMFMSQGRMKVVEQWTGVIPETIVDQSPWLLYWRGMCMSGWRHVDSKRDLEGSFEKFRQYQDVIGMLLCASAMIFSIQGSGDSSPMDPWIARIEELTEDTSVQLPTAIEVQVTAAMLGALAVRIPQHPEGQRWAERALALARNDSNLAFRALTALNWLIYQTELGNMDKAARVIDDLRTLQSSDDVAPVVAVNASMGIAFYESLFGLPSYRQTVSRMLELAGSSGMFYAARYCTLGYGLFGALSDGDLELARSWIEEMPKGMDTLGPGFNAYQETIIVRLALLQGDLDRAAAHQPEMLRFGILAGWSLIEAMVRLISAVVLEARGNATEAHQHIESTLTVGREMKSPYVEFMARTIEAHICFDNGEEAKASQSLRIAMELGRKGSFVNSQVWMPNIMAKLCAKALEHGIEVDYARMLIRKRNLVPEEAPADIEAWPWPIRIYTLGQFIVHKDDKPLSFSHKVQKKPLALLKAIIAFGGKAVREDLLIDTLWPDSDGDAAVIALNSAIYRLRKLLCNEQAIMRINNKVTLNDRYCWVDVWAVERLLARSETLTRSHGDERSWNQSIELLRKASRLYKGPFLDTDPEVIWSTNLTDRLRRRLLHQLTQLGQYWHHREDLPQAVASYEEALRIDPCAEDVTRKLMTAYHHLGRPSEVLATYRRCKEALANQLGIDPSAETERLVSQLSGK